MKSNHRNKGIGRSAARKLRLEKEALRAAEKTNRICPKHLLAMTKGKALPRQKRVVISANDITTSLRVMGVKHSTSRQRRKMRQTMTNHSKTPRHIRSGS